MYNLHFKDSLHISITITILALRIVIISIKLNKFINEAIINILLGNRILDDNMTLLKIILFNKIQNNVNRLYDQKYVRKRVTKTLKCYKANPTFNMQIKVNSHLIKKKFKMICISHKKVLHITIIIK